MPHFYRDHVSTPYLSEVQVAPDLAEKDELANQGNECDANDSQVFTIGKQLMELKSEISHHAASFLAR